ncbi:hypothetical protein K1719_019658 [Acacia pycnantha]|nr:hypothetical protein K1719_019658 [Acacia pycnantha]
MSDHLPPEIVLEILYRLPGKSLVKFTSVCKAWNSLITDQTFTYDHLNRTIQVSNGNNIFFFHLYFQEFRGQRRHLLMHHEIEYFYSLYSVNKQTNHSFLERLPFSHLFQQNRWPLFVSTSNGLVCLTDCYSPLDCETILIWNPFLRKYLVLPKPIKTFKKREHLEYSTCFGFGFDSRNKDHKVIRLMNHSRTQDTPHVEVYSLVSRSWRSITVRVPQFRLRSYNWLRTSFVNGAVHWVVIRRRSDGLDYTFILSFDVTEETFRELTLPRRQLGESEWIHSILLVVEGGHSLAVVNRRYRNQQLVYNIWVMKEYGIAESWTKLFEFDQSHYGGISDILALARSGIVVMDLVDGAIVIVDPIKELVEPLAHPAYYTTYVGSYVESLFFINKEPGVLSF